MPFPIPSLNAGVITGIVVNRSGVLLMARILGNLGVPITQATVSAIAWKVVDLTAGSVVGSGTFVVATTVFNNLVQNDPRWIKDSVNAPGQSGFFGYNFAATLPAATFTATPLVARADLVVSDRLHCDVTFTPTSGEPFVIEYEWTPLAAY